ncbi:hypothetical protein WI372_00460 [Gemmatimonadota bacterium DH-20]|uniref:Uncharacterized protein n=1 Tax=Gaopeijia maritima TaxID=3119007 RepID=A0ABU9E5R1_9BACT
MKGALRWAAVFVVLAMGLLQWRQREEREQVLALRDSLVEARGAATACSQALAISEAEFQVRDDRVDSLRSIVDTLEALDPRGVPAPRYAEYLATVDAYNDEVARWEADADSLQRAQEGCRGVVERYNQLADSARDHPGLVP